MEVSEQELALYALNKQLRTAYAIGTRYGAIDLDEELLDAVVRVLTPILERRCEVGGAK